ncbi:MAG: glycosyltransferase [Thiobacillus sp.]|nr:glycosyltransferase [Thiobacillus sp.]
MSGPAAAPRSLHVIGGKGLGGAERFFVRLVNALARHGQPVAAITVADGEIARALDPDVRQYHAPMLGVWDLYSRWKINRAIADFQPDVVQTYMGRATRIVHLPRQRPPVHLARLGGYYKLKGYRHAHAWVGNTGGIRDYLTAHGLPADRVHHIGNFVDTPQRLEPAALDALRAQLGLKGCRIVLGLGRLHPNKGWGDLLRAFAQLPASIQDAPLHLLMVGDGPLRKELEALASQLGIASRVHWAGWKTDPAPYYQLADVFVCASVHEPLGNVILEAWANRALLVSTRAQGPLELMTDDVNGLLAPLADPRGLAEVLHAALSLDSAHTSRLIEAGHAEVDRHYSEAAIMSAYTALYAGLRDLSVHR